MSVRPCAVTRVATARSMALQLNVRRYCKASLAMEKVYTCRESRASDDAYTTSACYDELLVRKLSSVCTGKVTSVSAQA